MTYRQKQFKMEVSLWQSPVSQHKIELLIKTSIVN